VGGVAVPGAVVADPASPVVDELQLLVLQRCVAGADTAELRQWAPWGWRGLCRRALEPLVERGLLLADQDKFTTAALPRNPFLELVAVELKLRDWRRGIAQAGGNRAFANRSYLALPERRLSPDLREAAKRSRVGVLAILDDGAVVPAVDCPSRLPLRPHVHDLVAQRALALAAEPGDRRAGAAIS
jgi:hypothetical protein